MGPTGALAQLLRALCADSVPPPADYGPIQVASFKPWTQEHFGVVAVSLASSSEWDVMALESLVGPLHRVPSLHGPSRTVQGIFDDPALPAWAAVLIDLDPADRHHVESLTIRTEPRHEA